MSASLVGSEMCIRDRSVVLGPWVRGSAGPRVRGPWSVVRSQWCVGPWSVSYTHLTLPTICSV
eukprot:12836789-Alexandrium_andersonii.AAC.1